MPDPQNPTMTEIGPRLEDYADDKGNVTLDNYERYLATKHKVPLELAKAIRRGESGGGGHYGGKGGTVISSATANARGRYQVLPSTAKALGITNLDDPAENTRAGILELRRLHDLAAKHTDNDEDRWIYATSGYFGGEGNLNRVAKTGQMDRHDYKLDKQGRKVPGTSTFDYVQGVIDRTKQFRAAGEGSDAAEGISNFFTGPPREKQPTATPTPTAAAPKQPAAAAAPAAAPPAWTGDPREKPLEGSALGELYRRVAKGYSRGGPAQPPMPFNPPPKQVGGYNQQKQSVYDFDVSPKQPQKGGTAFGAPPPSKTPYADAQRQSLLDALNPNVTRGGIYSGTPEQQAEIKAGKGRLTQLSQSLKNLRPLDELKKEKAAEQAAAQKQLDAMRRAAANNRLGIAPPKGPTEQVPDAEAAWQTFGQQGAQPGIKPSDLPQTTTRYGWEPPDKPVRSMADTIRQRSGLGMVSRVLQAEDALEQQVKQEHAGIWEAGQLEGEARDWRLVMNTAPVGTSAYQHASKEVNRLEAQAYIKALEGEHLGYWGDLVHGVSGVVRDMPAMIAGSAAGGAGGGALGTVVPGIGNVAGATIGELVGGTGVMAARQNWEEHPYQAAWETSTVPMGWGAGNVFSRTLGRVAPKLLSGPLKKFAPAVAGMLGGAFEEGIPAAVVEYMQSGNLHEAFRQGTQEALIGGAMGVRGGQHAARSFPKEGRALLEQQILGLSQPSRNETPEQQAAREQQLSILTQQRQRLDEQAAPSYVSPTAPPGRRASTGPEYQPPQYGAGQYQGPPGPAAWAPPVPTAAPRTLSENEQRIDQVFPSVASPPNAPPAAAPAPAAEPAAAQQPATVAQLEAALAKARPGSNEAATFQGLLDKARQPEAQPAAPVGEPSPYEFKGRGPDFLLKPEEMAELDKVMSAPEFGKSNKLVNIDEASQRVADLWKQIGSSSQTNIGASPEILGALTKLGVGYAEAGIRAFPQWSAAMIKKAQELQLPLSWLRSELRGIYTRMGKELGVDLTPPEQVAQHAQQWELPEGPEVDELGLGGWKRKTAQPAPQAAPQAAAEPGTVKGRISRPGERPETKEYGQLADRLSDDLPFYGGGRIDRSVNLDPDVRAAVAKGLNDMRSRGVEPLDNDGLPIKFTQLPGRVPWEAEPVDYQRNTLKSGQPGKRLTAIYHPAIAAQRRLGEEALEQTHQGLRALMADRLQGQAEITSLTQVTPEDYVDWFNDNIPPTSPAWGKLRNAIEAAGLQWPENARKGVYAPEPLSQLPEEVDPTPELSDAIQGGVSPLSNEIRRVIGSNVERLDNFSKVYSALVRSYAQEHQTYAKGLHHRGERAERVKYPDKNLLIMTALQAVHETGGNMDEAAALAPALGRWDTPSGHQTLTALNRLKTPEAKNVFQAMLGVANSPSPKIDPTGVFVSAINRWIDYHNLKNKSQAGTLEKWLTNTRNNASLRQVDRSIIQTIDHYSNDPEGLAGFMQTMFEVESIDPKASKEDVVNAAAIIQRENELEEQGKGKAAGRGPQATLPLQTGGATTGVTSPLPGTQAQTQAAAPGQQAQTQATPIGPERPLVRAARNKYGFPTAASKLAVFRSEIKYMADDQLQNLVTHLGQVEPNEDNTARLKWASAELQRRQREATKTQKAPKQARQPKQGAPVGQEPKLPVLTFIRSKLGGINLASAVGGFAEYGGSEIKDIVDVPANRSGGLLNSKGMSPEYVRDALVEAGYLEEESGVGEFLDLIHKAWSERGVQGKQTTLTEEEQLERDQFRQSLPTAPSADLETALADITESLKNKGQDKENLRWLDEQRQLIRAELAQRGQAIKDRGEQYRAFTAELQGNIGLLKNAPEGETQNEAALRVAQRTIAEKELERARFEQADFEARISNDLEMQDALAGKLFMAGMDVDTAREAFKALQAVTAGKPEPPIKLKKTREARTTPETTAEPVVEEEAPKPKRQKRATKQAQYAADRAEGVTPEPERQTPMERRETEAARNAREIAERPLDVNEEAALKAKLAEPGFFDKNTIVNVKDTIQEAKDLLNYTSDLENIGTRALKMYWVLTKLGVGVVEAGIRNFPEWSAAMLVKAEEIGIENIAWFKSQLFKIYRSTMAYPGLNEKLQEEADARLQKIEQVRQEIARTNQSLSGDEQIIARAESRLRIIEGTLARTDPSSFKDRFQRRSLELNLKEATRVLEELRGRKKDPVGVLTRTIAETRHRIDSIEDMLHQLSKPLPVAEPKVREVIDPEKDARQIEKSLNQFRAVLRQQALTQEQFNRKLGQEMDRSGYDYNAETGEYSVRRPAPVPEEYGPAPLFKEERREQLRVTLEGTARNLRSLLEDQEQELQVAEASKTTSGLAGWEGYLRELEDDHAEKLAEGFSSLRDAEAFSLKWSRRGLYEGQARSDEAHAAVLQRFREERELQREEREWNERAYGPSPLGREQAEAFAPGEKAYKAELRTWNQNLKTAIAGGITEEQFKRTFPPPTAPPGFNAATGKVEAETHIGIVPIRKPKESDVSYEQRKIAFDNQADAYAAMIKDKTRQMEGKRVYAPATAKMPAKWLKVTPNQLSKLEDQERLIRVGLLKRVHPEHLGEYARKVHLGQRRVVNAEGKRVMVNVPSPFAPVGMSIEEQLADLRAAFDIQDWDRARLDADEAAVKAGEMDKLLDQEVTERREWAEKGARKTQQVEAERRAEKGEEVVEEEEEEAAPEIEEVTPEEAELTEEQKDAARAAAEKKAEWEKKFGKQGKPITSEQRQAWQKEFREYKVERAVWERDLARAMRGGITEAQFRSYNKPPVRPQQPRQPFMATGGKTLSAKDQLEANALSTRMREYGESVSRLSYALEAVKAYREKAQDLADNAPNAEDRTANLAAWKQLRKAEGNIKDQIANVLRGIQLMQDARGTLMGYNVKKGAKSINSIVRSIAAEEGVTGEEVARVLGLGEEILDPEAGRTSGKRAADQETEESRGRGEVVYMSPEEEQEEEERAARERGEEYEHMGKKVKAKAFLEEARRAGSTEAHLNKFQGVIKAFSLSAVEIAEAKFGAPTESKRNASREKAKTMGLKPKPEAKLSPAKAEQKAREEAAQYGFTRKEPVEGEPATPAQAFENLFKKPADAQQPSLLDVSEADIQKVRRLERGMSDLKLFEARYEAEAELRDVRRGFADRVEAYEGEAQRTKYTPEERQAWQDRADKLKRDYEEVPVRYKELDDEYKRRVQAGGLDWQPRHIQIEIKGEYAGKSADELQQELERVKAERVALPEQRAARSELEIYRDHHLRDRQTALENMIANPDVSAADIQKVRRMTRERALNAPVTKVFERAEWGDDIVNLGAATHEDILAAADITSTPELESLGSYVAQANNAGIAVVEMALEDLGYMNPDADGLAIPLKAVPKLAEALRKYGEAGDFLARYMEAVVSLKSKGHEVYGDRIVLVNAADHIDSQHLYDNVQHELFHLLQFDMASEKDPAGLNRGKFVMQDPDYPVLVKAFKALGENTSSANIEIEAAGYIASGDWKAMGFQSADHAKAYLKRYIRHLVREYGIEKLNKWPLMAVKGSTVAQAIREVQNEAKRAEKTKQKRKTDRTAAEEARAQAAAELGIELSEGTRDGEGDRPGSKRVVRELTKAERKARYEKRRAELAKLTPAEREARRQRAAQLREEAKEWRESLTPEERKAAWLERRNLIKNMTPEERANYDADRAESRKNFREQLKERKGWEAEERGKERQEAEEKRQKEHDEWAKKRAEEIAHNLELFGTPEDPSKPQPKDLSSATLGPLLNDPKLHPDMQPKDGTEAKRIWRMASHLWPEMGKDPMVRSGDLSALEKEEPGGPGTKGGEGGLGVGAVVDPRAGNKGWRKFAQIRQTVLLASYAFLGTNIGTAVSSSAYEWGRSFTAEFIDRWLFGSRHDIARQVTARVTAADIGKATAQTRRMMVESKKQGKLYTGPKRGAAARAQSLLPLDELKEPGFDMEGIPSQLVADFEQIQSHWNVNKAAQRQPGETRRAWLARRVEQAVNPKDDQSRMEWSNVGNYLFEELIRKANQIPDIYGYSIHFLAHTAALTRLLEKKVAVRTERAIKEAETKAGRKLTIADAEYKQAMEANKMQDWEMTEIIDQAGATALDNSMRGRNYPAMVARHLRTSIAGAFEGIVRPGAKQPHADAMKRATNAADYIGNLSFWRIPMGMVHKAGKMTFPFGLINVGAMYWKWQYAEHKNDVQKNRFKAQFIDAISDMVVGSGVIAGSGFLFGVLGMAAGGARDWEEEEAMRAQGIQPFSINLSSFGRAHRLLWGDWKAVRHQPGDVYYRGSKYAAPLALAFEMGMGGGAALRKFLDGRPQSWIDYLMATTWQPTKAMATSMQEITALDRVFSDIQRAAAHTSNVGEWFGALATNALSQTVGSFGSPAALVQAKKLTDKYEREGRGESFLGNMARRPLSKLPGVSHALPAKHDVYGQPIETEPGMSWWTRFIPGTFSRYKGHAIIEAGIENDKIPGRVKQRKEKLGQAGETIEQTRQRGEERGQRILNAGNVIAQNEAFKQLSKAEQDYILAEIADRAGDPKQQLTMEAMIKSLNAAKKRGPGAKKTGGFYY